MVSGRIRGISSGADTRSIVQETLGQVSSGQRKQIVSMFKTAAGADFFGHRHLDTAEAQMVRAALEAAQTPAGIDLDTAQASIETQVRDLLKAKDPDGVRTYFTSKTKNVNQKVIDAMKETVADANGRRVDINIMIFSFTDKKVSDAMVKIAKANPNVHFNLITDFSQLSKSGGRKAPVLAGIAAEENLNISVKFKRDAPWVWSESKQRPVYNHSSSKGLNHHKGFVSLIDGRPHRLVTGSFNWSPTAVKSNYENLFVVDAKNPANRGMMKSYAREFTAFFNHADSLNYGEAVAHKRTIYNQMRSQHGLSTGPAPGNPAPTPTYAPPVPPPIVDINHMSDANHKKLGTLLKNNSMRRSIQYQFATYGPYSSFENLLNRVPKLEALGQEKLEQIRDRLEYGEGGVQINHANTNELMRSLKISKTAATAIIAKRKSLGDFESADQLKGLPGISSSTFSRIKTRLNDDVGRAFFSARAMSWNAATTGYAPENAEKLVPVLGEDGQVVAHEANLSAAAIDMFRRAQPGDTVKLALYGLSASSTEYGEIVDAAARGVNFKVILNKAYNGGVANALETLRESGLPIETRIISNKTMHMKFGVVNDDLFQGSANMSNSSSTKHSEDRFLLKNNQSEADTYHAQHDFLWDKAKPVAG